jgi:hypothetical protein
VLLLFPGEWRRVEFKGFSGGHFGLLRDRVKESAVVFGEGTYFKLPAHLGNGVCECQLDRGYVADGLRERHDDDCFLLQRTPSSNVLGDAIPRSDILRIGLKLAAQSADAVVHRWRQTLLEHEPVEPHLVAVTREPLELVVVGSVRSLFAKVRKKQEKRAISYRGV